MDQQLFTLFILTVCLHQVSSSCRMYITTPDPKDRELYCEYEGFKMRNGSSFKSPAPFCEECTCDGITLDCCKYGAYAGSIGIPDCEHVPIEGSCELNLRKRDDHTKPCFEPMPHVQPHP